MELTFAMPLVFKESLASGDHGERNAYASWKNRFSGKVVFLIGWCDNAFAVVDRLGDYHCENISGHPSFLFETPNVQIEGPGAASCGRSLSNAGLGLDGSERE